MVFLILLILIIFLIYFFNGRDCNLLGFSLILFTLLRIWSIYLFSELPIFILALNCCFLVSSDPFFFYRSIFLFAINYLVQLDWEWLHRGPLKGTKVQKLLALTWRCPYSLVPFCLHWHWCLLLISNFYFASNVDAVRQRSHLAFHKFWNFLWAGVNDSVKKQLLSAPHDVKAKGHSLAYIYICEGETAFYQWNLLLQHSDCIFHLFTSEPNDKACLVFCTNEHVKKNTTP